MKTGRKVTFYGAFASKERAKRKEHAVGGFIKRAKVRGAIRYIVMTRKGK